MNMKCQPTQLIFSIIIDNRHDTCISNFSWFSVGLSITTLSTVFDLKLKSKSTNNKKSKARVISRVIQKIPTFFEFLLSDQGGQVELYMDKQID